MPQMVQEPRLVLPRDIPQVVLEGPLQLAVGLGMPDRGANQANAQLPTKRLDEHAFKR